ncbi:hypothetical protein [Streptomyces katrae]|uniref:hypothetical protein n=1 Tax=Streptomyces katrae TaxID=68223 RepID=UPI00133164C7|nr:hypothetical protein [Streptomyces katrae]
MSAAGAERAPVVSMRALLAAGVAASAVSTPPARSEASPPDPAPEGAADTEQAASVEPEAA